jgi:copper transport protein
VPVTQTAPAVALVAPDAGTWLVGALMAVDRLLVSTGLLVLLGGAGLVAVARVPTPAWRLTHQIEGRAWFLLRVAWWATVLGTLAGLLLHGPFTAGLPLGRALDATLLTHTVGRASAASGRHAFSCCCFWLPSCEPGRSGKLRGRAPAPG